MTSPSPLTGHHFLRWLRLRRHLSPLLLEAIAESTTLEAARAASLAVSPDDLQRAADAFRRRHGLATAEATRAWLDREGLSPADFEESLERDLLLERFKDHLAATRTAPHFAAHRDRYARVRLRHVVVASEGVARELHAQHADEGADFAHLARLHSLDLASARAGGLLGLVHRCRLPPAAADAVFAARPGGLVGPLPGPGGFALYLVEELVPAELDDATAALIRQELFDGWLRGRLAGVEIDLAALEAADGPA